MLETEHPALARIAREDPMFARVLADPEDAALRTVWADSLLERGDPLGELISIQALAGGPLTPAQDKRVRSLIARHRLDWLGELADVVQHREGLVLDRGVLASCQVQVNKLAALGAAVGHPLWAGLRSIWFCDRYAWDPRVVPMLVHPVMRSLREVICIGASNVFVELARHERPLPITDIWTIDDAFRSPPQSVRELSDAPGLPALKRLGFTPGDDERTWITALPIVRRIETLGVVDTNLGAWMRSTQDLDNLNTLELRPHWIPLHGAYRFHCIVKLHRRPHGRWSQLEIDAVNVNASWFTGATEELFASTPVDAIERITAPRALHDALRRFERAELVASDPASPAVADATPAKPANRKPTTNRKRKAKR